MSPPVFWAPQVTTRPSAIAQKADAVEPQYYRLQSPESCDRLKQLQIPPFLLSSEDNFLWCLEDAT